MAKNDGIGAWGEAIAAEALRRKGFSLLMRNYRSRCGEIDLIMQNTEYLVFVEVKLRKNSDYGAAREFVDARKQEKLRQTALLWLEEHETALQPRFDVIEIYAPEGLRTRCPAVRHIEDAFL